MRTGRDATRGETHLVGELEQLRAGGRAEGQDGLDGVADGVRAIRLQLVEAAGVVVASDEEIRGRSQKDGQQREELVVDVADDQLVRLGALLQDIQVLR